MGCCQCCLSGCGPGRLAEADAVGDEEAPGRPPPAAGSCWVVPAALRETSLREYRRIVAECLAEGVLWTDTAFHWELALSNMGPVVGAKSLEWTRVGATSHRRRVLPDKVSGWSVRQGKLGNCPLIASVAALCSYNDGELLRKIFEHVPGTPEEAAGAYLLQFYRNGAWATVCVDDYVPIVGGTGCPAFATSPAGDIWPLLLEKAYAKFYGSYAAINSSNVGESLYDLCGLPVESISLRPLAATQRSRSAAPDGRADGPRSLARKGVDADAAPLPGAGSSDGSPPPPAPLAAEARRCPDAEAARRECSVHGRGDFLKESAAVPADAGAASLTGAGSREGSPSPPAPPLAAEARRCRDVEVARREYSAHGRGLVQKSAAVPQVAGAASLQAGAGSREGSIPPPAPLLAAEARRCRDAEAARREYSVHGSGTGLIPAPRVPPAGKRSMSEGASLGSDAKRRGAGRAADPQQMSEGVRRLCQLVVDDRCCVVLAMPLPADKGARHAKLPNGLIAGHAYALLDIVFTAWSPPLCQIYNPWGTSAAGGVWNGAWGMRAPQWTDRREAEVFEGGFRCVPDGVFFMPAAAVLEAFDVAHVCRTSLRGAPVSRFDGRWGADNSGGSRDFVSFRHCDAFELRPAPRPDGGSAAPRCQIVVANTEQRGVVPPGCISYNPIGFTVLKPGRGSLTDGAAVSPASLVAGSYEVVHKMTYWNKREVAAQVALPRAEVPYLCVVGPYYPGVAADYAAFFRTEDVAVSRVQFAAKPRLRLCETWKQAFDREYLLQGEEDATVHVFLCQQPECGGPASSLPSSSLDPSSTRSRPLAPSRSRTAARTNPPNAHGMRDIKLVIRLGQTQIVHTRFSPYTEVVATFQAVRDTPYVVTPMVKTYDRENIPFELSLYSSSASFRLSVKKHALEHANHWTAHRLAAKRD
ncbi:Calpain-A [Diplonema papillatum]|nr:Calpain-A [Diplonema papillatum]